MGQNVLLSQLYGQQCAGNHRAADPSAGTCLSAQGSDVEAVIPLEEARKKKKMEGNRKAIFDQWFQKKQKVKGQILIPVALFTDVGTT